MHKLADSTLFQTNPNSEAEPISLLSEQDDRPTCSLPWQRSPGRRFQVFNGLVKVQLYALKCSYDFFQSRVEQNNLTDHHFIYHQIQIISPRMYHIFQLSHCFCYFTRFSHLQENYLWFCSFCYLKRASTSQQTWWGLQRMAESKG